MSAIKFDQNRAALLLVLDYATEKSLATFPLTAWPITNLQGIISSPSWSPGGRWLALTSLSGDVYLVRPDMLTRE